MGLFNMTIISLDYYERVDAYMNSGCRDCGFCTVERERNECWGATFTYDTLYCAVLVGDEPECPRVPLNPEDEE